MLIPDLLLDQDCGEEVFVLGPIAIQQTFEKNGFVHEFVQLSLAANLVIVLNIVVFNPLIVRIGLVVLYEVE